MRPYRSCRVGLGSGASVTSTPRQQGLATLPHGNATLDSPWTKGTGQYQVEIAGHGEGEGRRRRMAIDYRSKQVWGQLPVVHIAVGGRQADGRYRLGRARGIIALGDVAIGLVAVGGVAIGLLSVGGVAWGWSRSAPWPSGWQRSGPSPLGWWRLGRWRSG
jgi:hypothetical protein